MDEKNINLKDNLIIWITRFVVNAIITTFYVTPIYAFLFLIIFNNYSLLSEISIKCYLLVYLIAYCFFFILTSCRTEKNKN